MIELSQRIWKVRARDQRDPTPVSSMCPLAYNDWKNSKSMGLACEDVKSKKLSLRQAEEFYGVPKSIIHNRIRNKVSGACRPGSEKYLSTIEEEELSHFLLGCAAIGYPRTRQQVVTIVQQHIWKKGIEKEVTSGWWQQFRERYLHITLRTPSPLVQPRAKAMSRDTMEKYFQLLKETMVENNLIDKPRLIFNCDESGMPLAPKSPKVVAKKGQKDPSQITSDTKTQVSILACVSASGDCIPPFVIFNRRMRDERAVGEVPDTY